MKILLLAENWPPRVGGIENYLSHLAGAMPEGSVTVIAPKGSDTARENFGEGVNRIEARRFFSSLIRPKWLPLFIKLWPRVKRGEFSAMYCGKALFEGLIGYYFKRYLGLPYIVFTYGMEIESWSANGHHRRKMKRVLQAADRVIYMNEFTKKSLLGLGVPEKRLKKLWPGVDEVFFQPVSEETKKRVQEKYRLPDKYILSVGRLVPRKGFDTLIEGFSRLDQTRFGEAELVIVGNGPEWASLQRSAKDNFVEKSVHFLTDVPDADLPAIYSGAELFALVPRQTQTNIEGFGIVYGEAAAVGLPAIASDTGGAKEAVIDGETGIVVPPDDAAALKTALERLLSDLNERARLGVKAKARAEKELRWWGRDLIGLLSF